MKLITTCPVLFFLLICFNFTAIAQTPCSSGTAAGYPCNNIDLMAFMPKASIGGGGSAELTDIWGWTDTLTGNEYAIIGLTTGTSFVDVTNPVVPVYLGFLPTATSNSNWRDVKVYNNHVFIVSEAGNHGVQSFDLTNLRSVTPPASFAHLAHFTNVGTGGAHNIVGLAETGYMVVVGANCSGGLIFVNVQDPANMTLEGCFSADAYTHDAVCFIYQGPDTEHYGKEICIGSNTDTQTIVDVTDKGNPIQLSRTGYPNSRYTHQGWITDDHKYLLFDDELDETNNTTNTRTFIMDISDLDSPVFMGFYEASTAAIDHNLYIKGQYAYQSNYRAGLRMLDIQNVAAASLSEVAFFDTYPANDNANFNANWSNYPYFKSGNIILSDIEQGLFIVRPNVPHFVMESDRLPKTVCENTDITFNIDLTAYAGYADMVDLSVSGVPAGATATFGSTSIAPSSSTTLTISNTAGLDGPFSLLIQGRGPANNSVGDLSVSFKILPQPGISNPAIPADNSTDVDPNTVFSWSADANAVSYTLEIATDPSFSTIFRTEGSLNNNSYVASPGLASGTTYYWRVRGGNSCGFGPNSATFEFRTSGTLAVELADFTGELVGGNVHLDWKTLSETNNKGFNVLRATATENFREIGFVAGKGTTLATTEYTFTDREINQGETYYYRLRQTDEDGEWTLSDVISIKIVGPENAYTLAPNPVRSTTQLSMTLPQAEEMSVKVLTVSTKEIATYSVNGTQGYNELELITSEWPAGVYFVQISGGTSSVTLRLLVL